MLLRSKCIDFTSPECKLAASYLLIDLERNVIDHLACLTAYAVAVICKILRAEGLYCE